MNLCRTLNKYFLLAGLAAAMAMALYSFHYSLDKPFTLDETDIANRSHMITLAGPRGPEIAMGGDRGEAMPHPPLYEYLIAAVFKLFGETETSARAFGVLCFALIGCILHLTIRELLRGETEELKEFAGTFGLILFLVNPLLLQHTLLIDADTTCIAVLTALFGYVFVRYEREEGKVFYKSRALLAMIFAAAYLSKEITPTFISMGLIGYRLLNRQWKKMAIDFIGVVLLGLVLAWTVWGLYCVLTGTDILIFLKQQYVWRVKRLDNWAFYKKVFQTIVPISRWPLFWMTAPFFLALVFSLVWRLIRFVRARTLERADYLFLTATLIWIPYLLVKPSVDMMKYQHPIYPLFIAGVAYCFGQALKPFLRTLEEKPWILTVFWAVSCALALGLTFYYLKLGDYILYLWENLNSWRWKAINVRYFIPIGVVLAVVTAVSLFKKRGFKVLFFIACFWLIVPISAALNIHQTAKYTTAESWLNYGEVGMRDALEYLSENIRPGTVNALRKDFYYYMRYRYEIPGYKHFAVEDVFKLRGQENIAAFMKSGSAPEYILLDRTFWVHPPPGDMEKVFMRYYRKEKEIGSFIIFKKI